MQSYSQVLPASGTIIWDVPGKYFVLIGCTNAVDVTFFKQGKQLDLGKVTQILAGMEATLGDVKDTLPAFDRVRIDGTVGDTVTIGIGNGQVRYNRSQGNVAITGMPAVPWAGSPNVAIASMPATPWTGSPKIIQDGFIYGASYKSLTALAANTPDTIFTPAANVNGAIVWSAEFLSYNAATVPQAGFVSKASAPATVIDGDLIACTNGMGGYAANFYATGKLAQPVRIAAGKGLYYISTQAETAPIREALYTLL